MRDRASGLAFLLTAMVRAEPVRTVAAIAVISCGRAAVLVSALGLRELLEGDTVRGAALAAAGVGLGLAARYPIATVGVTLRERASLAIEERLARIATHLPGIDHYENPEFVERLDLVRRGSFELGEAVASIADNIAILFLLVSSAALLASVDPLLLLMPVAAVPSLLAAVAKERETARYEEDTAGQWRPKKDLRDLAWDANAGAELRLFGAARGVLRRQAEAAAFIDRRKWVAARRTGLVQAAGDAVLGIGQTLGVGLVAYRTARGDASAGDVALTIALGGRLAAAAMETSEGLRFLLRLLRVIARMRWLEDHANGAASDGAPARRLRAPDRLNDGLRLVDVSFRYPGTDVDVLRGVDLHLPAGSTVALVGENGAGKTTIVKLLCGFYRPTSGVITVDGVDLADLDIDDWRRRISATYQDFARLEFVARESVGVGRVEAIDDAASVAAAVRAAGAGEVVDRLPSGLESQLGASFDGGVDLSGGEWQRVAHARASMRDDPLLVALDEPTAALDPLAEQALFERVAALIAARRADGAVGVLVSHRFSTVRLADLIVVIEDGRIVEQGTHAALVEARGRYAGLFERQARAYR